MTIDLEALRGTVAPLLAPLSLEVYDIELTGSGRARLVRITVFRLDGAGLDLDVLSEATHAIERTVETEIDGAFQLEVSSPGLERKLARPEHFESAVGLEVSVKYRDADGAATRVRGRLTEAAPSAASITIVDEGGDDLVIARDAVIAARTVFEWGPAPRPGRNKPGAQRVKEKARS